MGFKKGCISEEKELERRSKISESSKSRHASGEKFGFQKGIKTKGSWKKGHIPWNKNKKNPLLKGDLNPAKRPEVKKKLSEKAKKRNFGKFWKGKKRSKKDKMNKRISAFKYMKENYNIICPRIGKHEKQILDKLETLYKYKIIRQYKVCGYFVDGYINELNLSIEVDEIPKISERDIRREKEIINKLNCNFLRIEDRFKW